MHGRLQLPGESERQAIVSREEFETFTREQVVSCFCSCSARTVTIASVLKVGNGRNSYSHHTKWCIHSSLLIIHFHYNVR
jgi:hypothetical protein